MEENDIYKQLSGITENADEIFRSFSLELERLFHSFVQGEMMIGVVPFQSMNRQPIQGILVLTSFRFWILSAKHAIDLSFPYSLIRRAIHQKQGNTENLEIEVLGGDQFYLYSFTASDSFAFYQTFQSLQNWSWPKVHPPQSSVSDPLPKDFPLDKGFPMDDFDIGKTPFLERLRNRFSGYGPILFKFALFAVLLFVMAVSLLFIQSRDLDEQPSASNPALSSISFEDFAETMTGNKYIKRAIMKNGHATIEYYSSFDEWLKAQGEDFLPTYWDNETLFNEYFHSDANLSLILAYEPVRFFTYVKGAESIQITVYLDGNPYRLNISKSEAEQYYGFSFQDIKTKKDWEEKYEQKYYDMQKMKGFIERFVK